MSNNPLITIDLDTHGLDRDLANAAALIETAAEQAGQQAAPVLAESIAQETPVRTGFLQNSERVFQQGSYEVWFAADAPYASFVAYGTSRQAANNFMERGARNVEVEVQLIYGATFQALTENFGDGR